MKALVVLLLILGCASARVQEPTPARMTIDEPLYNFFALMQSRLYGHATLDDQEYVLCLYGRYEGREGVRIKYVGATYTVADAESVEYALCADGADGMQYLGVWHAHPPVFEGLDACWFSPDDDKSFFNDKRAGIELVSCGQGKLLGRTRLNPRRWMFAQGE